MRLVGVVVFFSHLAGLSRGGCRQGVCLKSMRKICWLFPTEDRAAQSLLNKLIRSNLVDNTNQVEVLQRDPNSPLYSVKSFEELRL